MADTTILDIPDEIICKILLMLKDVYWLNFRLTCKRVCGLFTWPDMFNRLKFRHQYLLARAKRNSKQYPLEIKWNTHISKRKICMDCNHQLAGTKSCKYCKTTSCELCYNRNKLCVGCYPNLCGTCIDNFGCVMPEHLIPGKNILNLIRILTKSERQERLVYCYVPLDNIYICNLCFDKGIYSNYLRKSLTDDECEIVKKGYELLKSEPSKEVHRYIKYLLNNKKGVRKQKKRRAFNYNA